LLTHVFESRDDISDGATRLKIVLTGVDDDGFGIQRINKLRRDVELIGQPCAADAAIHDGVVGKISLESCPHVDRRTAGEHDAAGGRRVGFVADVEVTIDAFLPALEIVDGG
jgi:hypothetical protein